MLGMAMMGCSKSDDAQPQDTDDDQVAGSWIITYFFDKDQEETDMFSGYTFRFETSGTLIANANGTTFEGTWLITSDDGSQRLVISITGNDALQELVDDWVIQSITSEEIRLRDDNTEHVEELIFERI